MTLDELKLRHSALLAARYSGTRSVRYDGKTFNYGTDAELDRKKVAAMYAMFVTSPGRSRRAGSPHEPRGSRFDHRTRSPPRRPH